MSQTPSVGRIVHYHSYGTPGGEYLPEARAAVITSVDVQIPAGWKGDGFPVSLCVLNPTGMFFNELVAYAETPTPGHWSWPPRV